MTKVCIISETGVCVTIPLIMKMCADFLKEISAIGSAEDLPPRFRATPPDSAQKRADPRGVRRELAEEFTRKMSADKNLSFSTAPRGRTSAPDDPTPRKYS